MKTILNLRKLTMIVPLFGLLTACYHTDVGTPSLKDPVVRNTIQMVRLPHEIKAEEDGTDSLSSVTSGALASFLSSVEVSYADVILLDGPEVPTHRIDAIEEYLRKLGLVYGGQSALGVKPNKGAVMLYVERYIVSTPRCGEWLPEADNNSRNNDSPFHGCANIANLGLMIANPRDLISGYSSGASSAAAVRAIYKPKVKAPKSAVPAMTLSLSGLQAITNARAAAKK
ncbi:MAG: hypothetical protein JKY57_01000 [Kordiimonadaceae bacterium]|nr:hypothetical protein [Kordiimonadaceae bacterium]